MLVPLWTHRETRVHCFVLEAPAPIDRATGAGVLRAACIVTADSASMSLLTVDRRQIETFVDTLFRYADQGGFVQMRAFRDDSDGIWRPERWRAEVINGSGLRLIVDAAVALGAECAVATERVVFASPVATFQTAEGATEKNIKNGLVLTVECDKAPEAAREKLEALLGPATIVVASGGMWTDPQTDKISPKLHLHWRLTEPTKDFLDHMVLKEARRLAMVITGADGSAVPLCHPLRFRGHLHDLGDILLGYAKRGHRLHLVSIVFARIPARPAAARF